MIEPSPQELKWAVEFRHGGAFILGAAALSAIIGLAAFWAVGGGESGWQAAGLSVSRLSGLVFLIFLVAEPVARLFPAPTTEIFGRLRNDLIAAFLTAYAVSLIFANASVYPGDANLDSTTIASCLFAGLAGAILAFSASRNAKRLIGGKARDTLQWIGMSYFWLAFISEGLRHIYGPHRPDDYYGLSLLLLVGAVLLRFASALKLRISSGSDPDCITIG